MKPIPKIRRSLLETNENNVIKSEVVCYMFAEDSEDKQKENESNKNETTAGASATVQWFNEEILNCSEGIQKF